MTALRDDRAGAGWRRAAVLLLAVAAVGLPVNSLSGYALLTILAVVIFSGEVRSTIGAWLAAVTDRKSVV